MLEQGLVTLLAADTTLAGLIGGATGIWPVLVPETASGDALSYQVISSRSEYTLSGAVVVSRRMQFDAWSSTYANAKAIQRALHNVLDAYQGTLTDGTNVLGCFRSIELDDFEMDSRKFRVLSEYLIEFVES